MYVNADIEIEINDDLMAEAVIDSRYFTNAVEAVVENMDLNDILDAPSRSDVEIIVEDMGVPTSDDVYDIAREVVREEVSNYLSVSKFLSSSDGKQALKEAVEEVLAALESSERPEPASPVNVNTDTKITWTTKSGTECILDMIWYHDDPQADECQFDLWVKPAFAQREREVIANITLDGLKALKERIDLILEYAARLGK